MQAASIAGSNPTNLSLCPADPQRKAPGIRSSSHIQEKKNPSFIEPILIYLNHFFFLWLTRTSQAITLEMSLKTHIPGNPIAPTTDLLEREVMYLCLPKEVYYTEEATGQFIPPLILFLPPEPNCLLYNTNRYWDFLITTRTVCYHGT